MKIFASAFVRDGVLKVRNYQSFEAAVKRLHDGEVTLTVERVQATRSLEQNAFYWSVIVKELSEHTGYHPDEIHEYLKKRFNPKPLAIANQHGEIIDAETIGATTTTLTTVQFCDFTERIRQWAAEDLGVLLPQPDTNWRAA